MPRIGVAAELDNLDDPPEPLRVAAITIGAGVTDRMTLPQSELLFTVRVSRGMVARTIARMEVDALDKSEAARKALSMLDRLVWAIEILKVKVVSVGGIAVANSPFLPSSYGQRRSYRGGAASINAVDTPVLEKIVQTLDTRPARRIETAVLEFDTALKSTDVRRQFIHGMIALEALFGEPGIELSYKVALRGARLIPSLHDKQRAGFKRLQKAYDTRSKFVHGDWDEKTLQKAEEEIGDVLALTAEAIELFLSRIEQGLSTRFPDLDGEILF